MDTLFIDAKSVTPHYLRIYEELIDIELPLSATETVFTKKSNTLSYAFEKDVLSLGYYKILSATRGVVVFTLHKQSLSMLEMRSVVTSTKLLNYFRYII